MNEAIRIVSSRNTQALRYARPGAALLAAWLLPVASQAVPFPAELDIRTLDPANGGDGTSGVILQAAIAYENLGYSLSAAGDLNADGIDDIIVGGLGASPCTSCAAFVMYGRREPGPVFQLVQEAIASHGQDSFVARSGRQGGASPGQSVSSVGDLNADGLPDFIIGAPNASRGHASLAGVAYVVFGRGAGFPAVVDLNGLLPEKGGDGSQGFVLYGELSGDKLGFDVGGGCDFNGDGIDDLVAGAPVQTQDFTYDYGRVYVVFGHAGIFPPKFDVARLLPIKGGDGSEGVRIQAAVERDTVGWSVSCLGDTNGDGADDILTGAPFRNAEGGAFLILGHRGPASPTFNLAELLPQNGGDGSQGTVLDGIGYDDKTGYAVGAAGDVNDDGLADLLIGADTASPHGRSNAGRAYVVYGRMNNLPADFPLENLLPDHGGDGSAGFVLNGAAELDYAGISLEGAGDVNGDGIDDIVVGAHSASPPGRPYAGQAFVYYGRASGPDAPEIELASLLAANGGDGTRGFVIDGSDTDSGLGLAVAPAGDVNGDGVDDLLVGAPLTDDGPLTEAGKAYVIFGRATDGERHGKLQ